MSSAARFRGLASNGSLPGGESGRRHRSMLRAHGIQPFVQETRERRRRKPLGGREDGIDAELKAKGFKRTPYGWKWEP